MSELDDLRRDLEFFRKLSETYRQTSEEFRTIGEGWFKEKERLKNAAEMLWVVLANVSGGDWTKQTKEWQEVAARWRDNYFNAISRPEQEQGKEFTDCICYGTDLSGRSVCGVPCPVHGQEEGKKP
jgi:hypothetical protein